MNRGLRFKYVDLTGTSVCPEEHSHNKRSGTMSCTNILLLLIAIFTAIQAIVFLSAGISALNFYDNNKLKIDEWIKLPWDQMARTVGSTYEQEKANPVAGTLSNAFFAANELRKTVEYHSNNTFPQLKNFSDELMKHKSMIGKISNLTEETLPAVKKINKALGNGTVHDLTGILHKTNKVMNYLDNDKQESKKNYDRGTTLIDQVNHLMSPENVKKSLDAVEKIGKALDSTLTTDNVNKTIHAISDFDKSLHKAEDRLHKIGEIFGK